MNWLGKKSQKYVKRNDIVLDLGCGIMQATTNYSGWGNLKCKAVLGVDLFDRYLQEIYTKYPTVKTNVLNTKLFIDNSYDVVLCLDVLEHLELEQADHLLKEMKRIARRNVVIYTPYEFKSNEEHVNNVWGMGENKLQSHKCLVTKGLLAKHHYRAEHVGADNNLFAVWSSEEWV